MMNKQNDQESCPITEILMKSPVVLESSQTSEMTSMVKQNDQELCPINEILKKSPIVLESGQAFEATSVERIKDACNQRLPTGSDLFPEAALIPRRKVKKLVAKLGPGFYTPATSPSSSDEKPIVSVDSLKHLLALLEKIPCSSVSEEIVILKKLRLFVTRSPAVRTLLGQIKGAFNKLLNPTSVERSYSDASLQEVLVTVVLEITSDEDNGKKVVQECPNVIPFLITCLRSKTTDTRRFAAVVIRGLSFQLDLNIRTVIGESGVIKPLVELIGEGGDPEALINAGSALLNLCRVSENRERAVSEGAVIVVMNKVVGRVLVERMLQTLEMLSRHEKAVAEMEEYGMLQCLFTILGEDVRENGKEYCVTIIHTMCHASSATKMRKLINEVENARETLAHVASTGTANAKVKASELLLKLNSISIDSD